MSTFVLAAPAALTAAASDIAGIGSSINSASATAAVPTTGVLAAAADEVSTQIAALFSSHAQGYQRLSAQIAAFHDQFVQALSFGASQYVAAEANAVQNLVNAVNTPAQKLLGQPLIGSGAAAGRGVVSNAVGGLQNVFGPSVAALNQAGVSALALRPTGGFGGLSAAAGALLRPAASVTAAVPAAILPVSFATAIENLYLAIEPWVAWGFSLGAYAAGWLPYVGWLAGQIYIFYALFEPMVEAGLFNILDWLSGLITFSQGLSNFWVATTASINQFIYNEINWFLGFLPPLPPLPPFP